MKKFLALAVLAFMAGTALAQTERPADWFIGAGGGVNLGFDGQKKIDRANSHAGLGTAGDFYIGKYFNDNIGFRAGYQGFNISDKYTVYAQDKFHYGHADLLFRVKDAIVPYVHAGYAHIDKGFLAGGAGIMFPVKVGRRISIVPDFKATLTNGNIFPTDKKGLGGILSGTLGLQVSLGKSAPKHTAPVYVPTPAPAPAPAPQPAPEPAPQKPVTPEPEPEVAPAPVPATPARELAALPDNGRILFIFKEKTLTPEAQETLDAWAAYLADHPEKEVIVEGHTCNLGAEWFNQILSEDRAKAVKTYLEGKGIDGARIETKGYGQNRPAETNDHPWTRARNRRVEIKVK